MNRFKQNTLYIHEISSNQCSLSANYIRFAINYREIINFHRYTIMNCFHPSPNFPFTVLILSPLTNELQRKWNKIRHEKKRDARENFSITISSLSDVKLFRNSKKKARCRYWTSTLRVLLNPSMKSNVSYESRCTSFLRLEEVSGGVVKPIIRAIHNISSWWRKCSKGILKFRRAYYFIVSINLYFCPCVSLKW